MSEEFENGVLDLGEIKKQQISENNADNSVMNILAAWLEYILMKMFKGRRIPVKVRGTRLEVSRFTDALVAEKRYMIVIQKYGLDDPMTYKNKAKLDVAIKRFERETGINWPLK
jgi:hypothetical protein